MTTSTQPADTFYWDKVSWASRSRLCCLGIPPAKWDPRSPYPTTFPSLSPRTNMFPLTLTLNPRVPSLTLHQSKCKLRGTKNKTFKIQFDPEIWFLLLNTRHPKVIETQQNDKCSYDHLCKISIVTIYLW